MTSEILQFSCEQFSKADLAEVGRWGAEAVKHGWYLQTSRRPRSAVENIVGEDDKGRQYITLAFENLFGDAVGLVAPRDGRWVVEDLAAGGAVLGIYGTLRDALQSIQPTSYVDGPV